MFDFDSANNGPGIDAIKTESFEYYMDKIMYQNYLHLIANFCVAVSNNYTMKRNHF